VIRVNLIGGERKRAKKKAVFATAHKLTVGCTIILIGAGALVGWRYTTLNRESQKLDADISAAQRETARLRSIIQQVQQFEQRRGQLQQRVALIEQLRKEQTGPVHMLDQISRALPPMLWLNEIKQPTGANVAANEVVIEGHCTTLTSLSDFVANLEASGYFKRSVEIVTSTTEPAKSATSPELIKFQVKALFQRPGEPAHAEANPSQKPEVKPRG
jgi:type IV pilus assembly protein PilN